MKKLQLRNIIREVIKEMIDANDYASATLTTQGPGRSRFTKTGRPPGVMENERKYKVMGSKGDDGGVQYGPDYDTEKEAQAVADRKNNNKKTKKLGISFTVQEKN